MIGIDISSWQTGMSVNTAHPDFCICKITEGTTWRDPSFDTFYKQCNALGVPVGAYAYSHSTSAEGGMLEAKAAISALAGRKLDLPLYIDIEDDILSAGKTALMASALAFCDTVRAAGYKPGVYASASPFKDVLDIPRLRAAGISIWCAAYNNVGPGVDCDIWQCSNTYRVSGYSGNLDKDVMIVNIIPEKPTVDDDDGKTESGLLTDDDDPIPTEPELKSKLTNETVMHLQAILATYGYDIGTATNRSGVDGYIGPKTVAALKDFVKKLEALL